MSEASQAGNLCAMVWVGVLDETCVVTASDGPMPAAGVFPIAWLGAADSRECFQMIEALTKLFLLDE